MSRVTRSATLRLHAAVRPAVASAVRLPLEPAVSTVEASPRLAAEALVALAELSDALHRRSRHADVRDSSEPMACKRLCHREPNSPAVAADQVGPVLLYHGTRRCVGIPNS